MEDQPSRKVEGLAEIATMVKVRAGLKRTIARKGRCLVGRPCRCPKRAREWAVAIESDEQNIAADGKCGGADGGDGHVLIARSEGDTVKPVQWLEGGQILTDGSPSGSSARVEKPPKMWENFPRKWNDA